MSAGCKALGVACAWYSYSYATHVQLYCTCCGAHNRNSVWWVVSLTRTLASFAAASRAQPLMLRSAADSPSSSSASSTSTSDTSDRLFGVVGLVAKLERARAYIKPPMSEVQQPTTACGEQPEMSGRGERARWSGAVPDGPARTRPPAARRCRSRLRRTCSGWPAPELRVGRPEQ